MRSHEISLARHARMLAAFLPIGALAACDSPVQTDRGAVPPPQLRIEYAVTVEVPSRPFGIAITPDGERVLVTSFIEGSVTILDAETYEEIGRAVATKEPRGVVIGGGGEFALLAAERGGLSRLSLDGDSMTMQADPDGPWTSYLVAGSQGDDFYGVGFLHDGSGAVFRITADADLAATYPLDTSVYAGLALSPDETVLLALEAGIHGAALHVLRLPDLALESRIELPDQPNQVVPLDDGTRALVFSNGNDPNGGIRSFLVDYRTGSVSEVGPPAGYVPRAYPEFGRGNPWVRIDAQRVVLGTTHGLIVIDTATGAMALTQGWVITSEFMNFCCALAYDEKRGRLLELRGVATNQREPGRLIVYDVAN